MLFEMTIPIEHSAVAEIVRECWELELGAVIKASQNHTFAASRPADGAKFAVRVTPDPERKHRQRIEDELQFVSYLSDAHLPGVCGPLKIVDRSPSASSSSSSSSSSEQSIEKGTYIATAGPLVVVVFHWADGAPLDFMKYRWLTDQSVVHAWGRWFAQLHAVSRSFGAERPDVRARMQRWDQIHCRILEGSDIHPDDQAAASDPQHYGVIHGDLNPSNFFFVEETQALSVFDWDQAQQAWYLMDMAQAALASVMLAEGGSLIDGSPVPEAKPQQFADWLIAGYESVAGEGAVDRARFQRMLQLRLGFYEKFCRRALVEGSPPGELAHFINYVVEWFDKRAKSAAAEST